MEIFLQKTVTRGEGVLGIILPWYATIIQSRSTNEISYRNRLIRQFISQLHFTVASHRVITVLCPFLSNPSPPPSPSGQLHTNKLWVGTLAGAIVVNFCHKWIDIVECISDYVMCSDWLVMPDCLQLPTAPP